VKPEPRHILVSRTDALGDALLALPVCTALKQAFPACRVTLLASGYTRDALLLSDPGPDEILVHDTHNEHTPPLRKILAVAGFDAALMVFPDPQVSWAVFLARIPLRVGTARRWWSFLYNRPVHHHRRLADRHEADYNLDLVRALGIPAVLVPPRLRPRAEDAAWASEYFQRQPLVILHPGGNGSAANWPAAHYSHLAEILMRDFGVKVFLTGSLREQPLLQAVAQASHPAPWRLTEPVNLQRLAALIAQAKAFVSGSTGPMHMAAGLGVPTVSLFPSNGVTGPVRWRPLGERTVLLTPPDGLAVASCAMEEIQPLDIARKIAELLV
jgi:ADP-heptose:LPS heptosyltransferase